MFKYYIYVNEHLLTRVHTYVDVLSLCLHNYDSDIPHVVPIPPPLYLHIINSISPTSTRKIDHTCCWSIYFTDGGSKVDLQQLC